MKKLILIAAIAVFLSSCKPNSDRTKQIEKDGSVEVVLSVKHLDSNHDLIKSEQTTWIHNYPAKKSVWVDTIPSLGDTFEQAEDDDGNDTSVIVPKNYQLFITVK
jgi:hypothetical protein